jgi:peroxiredoxin
MTRTRGWHWIVVSLFTAAITPIGADRLGGQTAAAGQSRPAIGDRARDFELKRLDGKAIRLSALTKDGPIVVLMLRGWVGYQCPICTRQVGEFLSRASDFQAAGASVVIVYPGAADLVQRKAEDFVTGKTLPGNFQFVIDPDLTVVNLYGVRWDAPGQNAYPSTFVFDRRGVVRFVKVSQSTGDRSSAAEVLQLIRDMR